ncbi:MAG: hypothetical protein QOG46_2489 [Pseudonocardiales bacterium]|nr:hypothetical protein [Pseudonocardiales bacterium]
MVMDLDLHDIERIDTERLHEKEALRVSFRRPELATLHLQVRPTVAVLWRIGAWPWEAHPTLQVPIPPRVHPRSRVLRTRVEQRCSMQS